MEKLPVSNNVQEGACSTCTSCQKLSPPVVYKGDAYTLYCRPEDTFMIRGPDACILKNRLEG
jgi:hypothetical protein